MKLYELQNELFVRLQEVDADDVATGNLPDEVIAELDALKLSRDEKVDSIGCIMRQLDLEAEAIKGEETRLADMRKLREARWESLHAYLSMCLLPLDKPLNTEHFRFSARKSTAVVIDNEDAVPAPYMRIVSSPDKALIAIDLKSGATIPGASLVERTNLQVK